MLAFGFPLVFVFFFVFVSFVSRFMADVYIILQVMPNTGAVFTSSSTSTSDTTDTNPSTNPKEPPLSSSSPMPQATPTKEQQTDKENQAEDLDDIHFDERLFVEAAPAEEDEDVDDELPLPDSDSDAEEKEDVQASTPKSNKHQSLNDSSPPSTIVTANTPPAARISPILKAPPKLLAIETINECEMETEDLMPENDLKRKRDSFDSVSLMSVDSFALPVSTKKPKLIRTGSITRTLKRSMSFVADRTPIIKTLRTRRSSIAAADASTFLGSEADDSMCSLASINTTLNESIRKPVKEKLRSICDRITRSSSRRTEREATPEFGQLDSGFKTPKAPLQRATASVSAKKTAKRLFGPVAGAGSATNCSNTFSTNNPNANVNSNDASVACGAITAVPIEVTSSSVSQMSSTIKSSSPSSSSTAVDSKEPNDVAAEEEPHQMVHSKAENNPRAHALKRHCQTLVSLSNLMSHVNHPHHGQYRCHPLICHAN